MDAAAAEGTAAIRADDALPTQNRASYVSSVSHSSVRCRSLAGQLFANTGRYWAVAYQGGVMYMKERGTVLRYLGMRPNFFCECDR